MAAKGEAATTLSGFVMATEWERIPTGPERGLWFWTITALRPGPRITFPTSGTEARRGDADRRVVEAYERLLIPAPAYHTQKGCVKFPFSIFYIGQCMSTSARPQPAPAPAGVF
jgi:hypothetical protein